LVRYIIDEDQERESYAIRRLMRTDVLRSRVFHPMGLGDFSWYLLEWRIHKWHRKPGDVDILGGPLACKDTSEFTIALERHKKAFPDAHPTIPELLAAKSVAEAGGIAWPPPLDFVVGLEVKCGYIRDGRARSTKSSVKDVADIRNKVDGLLALGLERVALMDIMPRPGLCRARGFPNLSACFLMVPDAA